MDPARPRPGAARGRAACAGGVAAGDPELSEEEKPDLRAKAEAEAFDPADFVEPEGGLAEVVVRGAGLAGFGFFATQTLTLVAYLVLARLASPSDFGVYAAGSLLVNIGYLFTESGMMAALIHRDDRIDEAASTAVVASAASGLLFSLLALAASPLIGDLFHSSRVGEIAAANSGMLFVRSLLIVPQSLLQRRFSFLRRTIVEPLGVVVFGIVSIIACGAGMGPWGLVLGYYAAAVADVLLSWLLIDWRPKLREVSYAMWRELAGYGRHVLVAHSVMLGTQQLGTLFVGRFSGSGPLGQLRYGERLSGTPVGLVIQAGAYVLFPAFARITGDRERFRDAMLRSLGLMSTISFPLIILLVPLGVPAAVLLFGAVWREAGYATMVLSAGAVAGTVMSFSSEVLKADGHPERLLRIMIAQLIGALLGMLAGLPLGMLGIAGGISVGTIAAAFFGLVQVHTFNRVSYREFRRQIMPPLLAALFMAAVLTPLEFLVIEADTRGTVVGLLLILFEAAIGLALYAATMALLDRRKLMEATGIGLGAVRRRRPA